MPTSWVLGERINVRLAVDDAQRPIDVLGLEEPLDETIHTRVHGDRDPGYGAAARMLSEAALALADPHLDTAPGGVHTPTSAFGDTLIDRLVEHAGLSFSIVE